jgi:hypothetical protein
MRRVSQLAPLRLFGSDRVSQISRDMESFAQEFIAIHSILILRPVRMMLKKKRFKKILLLGFLMVLVIRGVTAQSESRTDLAVVVNPSIPVDNVSLEDLRKIFLGERQFWSSNLPVVPLIRPQGTVEREVILRVLFRMSEIEYKKYWITKVFRAEAANEPAVALTNSFANDAVAAIPGSVTCESLKDVPRGAKVLRIDGHKPGEPGYPLR